MEGELCYSTCLEDPFSPDGPDQVAYDHLSYYWEDGVCEVYEGETYSPTNTDELEWMKGEGYEYCVKNIKLHSKWKLDKENDWVIEVKE